jgi:hypothetical protein
MNEGKKSKSFGNQSERERKRIVGTAWKRREQKKKKRNYVRRRRRCACETEVYN